MLSKKMEKALNEQVEMEAIASATYLSMASWCDSQGMEGAAQFFYGHAEEERVHMMKIFMFINDVDGHAIVPAQRKPQSNYKTVVEVCKKAYAHEQKVSKAIHNLVELAKLQNDHVTNEFLRWFVEEQREEEALFRKVIDKITLIGEGGQSLYYIDKELASVAAASAKESAQAANQA